jgi:hypothetical protein
VKQSIDLLFAHKSAVDLELEDIAAEKDGSVARCCVRRRGEAEGRQRGTVNLLNSILWIFRRNKFRLLEFTTSRSPAEGRGH